MENIFTIKFKNTETNRNNLIRFCVAYKVSVFLTWENEGVIDNYLFCSLLVPAEVHNKFSTLYKKLIISSEPLKQEVEP